MGLYPSIRYFDETNLVRVLLDINTETGAQWILETRNFTAFHYQPKKKTSLSAYKMKKRVGR